MKNYATWTTEALQEEEKSLKVMGYDEAPECGEDKHKPSYATYRKEDGHAEFLAVQRELHSRTNKGT